MRKSELSLRIICQEVKSNFETECNGKWEKRGRRPKEFCDVFIITLFIWQTLKGLSYREVLAEARQEVQISPALSIRYMEEGIDIL